VIVQIQILPQYLQKGKLYVKIRLIYSWICSKYYRNNK